jgi:hypothetical protein
MQGGKKVHGDNDTTKNSNKCKKLDGDNNTEKTKTKTLNP